MPKTTTRSDHDRDIDGFIESVDACSMRDARHLREITAARRAVQDAEARLRDAVAAARAAGDSWTAIGVALQTSKQNAHRKYGDA